MISSVFCTQTVMFLPRDIMALDVSKPASDVYLCDHEDDTRGCDVVGHMLLVLLWRRPGDTGSGDPDLVPIQTFEVELVQEAEATSTSFDFFEEEVGDLYAEEGLARVVLVNVQRGKPYTARVRVKTFLGVSAWNSTLTQDRRLALSRPSSPALRFVGSGGAPGFPPQHHQPFLMIVFSRPEDLGAGVGLNVTLLEQLKNMKCAIPSKR